MRNEKVINLRAQLKELEQKHEKLEVTVKEWNRQRRILDDLIQDSEAEQLKLKVEAWRLFTDTQELMLFDLE